MEFGYLSSEVFFSTEALAIVVIPLTLLIIGTFLMVVFASSIESWFMQKKGQFVFYFQIPKEFSTAIKQYLLYFREYVKTVKGHNVVLELRDSSTGIKLTIKPELKLRINVLKEWLDEYFTFFRSNNIKPSMFNVENTNMDVDKDQFFTFSEMLERQIRHLKESIEVVNRQVLELTEDKERLISDKLFLQEMIRQGVGKQQVIKKQVIAGGSQQFANQIITK